MSIFKDWFKDKLPAPPEDDDEEETYEIISREDAKASGYTYYFQGVACSSGHITKRYVTSGQCIQCVADQNVRYREKIAQREAARKAAPAPPPKKASRVVTKDSIAQAVANYARYAAKTHPATADRMTAAYAAKNAGATVKPVVPPTPPQQAPSKAERPPHEGQWKKGQSGNPNGRPLGSKNNISAYEQEIQRLKALLFDRSEKDDNET